MSFNIPKCGSLSCINSKARVFVESWSPTVNGTPLPAFKWKDRYCYLGLSLGRESGGLSEQLKGKILSGAQKISSSPLTDWQKIEAVNTFILPLADYYLKVGLASTNWVSSVDAAIRRMVKTAFRRTTTHIFYLDKSQGGYGLRSLEDRRDTARITSALRLLSTHDYHTANIAWNQLQAVASRRTNEPLTSVEDLITYQSSKPGSSTPGARTFGPRSDTLSSA